MAKKKKIITVEGDAITLLSRKDSDYISLTDIDKRFEGNGRHIENWLRNQNTVEYLQTWEELHNPSFNSMQLHGIREKIGTNRFLLSTKKWIQLTNAIGIESKTGRYGGTYAHADIAFHFCLWLSPSFQLYVAKEFQKLKAQEAIEQKESLEWHIKRTLARVNYRLHTDAIQQHLIPPRYSAKQQGMVYASEADLLNIALFGMTAREWKGQNPDKKGNMRDHATGEQLIVLANLENLNADYISQGLETEERLQRLNEVAIYQMQVLTVPPDLTKGLA